MAECFSTSGKDVQGQVGKKDDGQRKKKLIYFQIGDRKETAEFYSDTNVQELQELFRTAAEASFSDIVKLFNHDGHLVNIHPNLEENTPATRYSLQVATVAVDDMLKQEIGVDIMDLENRIFELERQLKHQNTNVPPVITELKNQVEVFKKKLETTEHMSWLGFHNEIMSPVSSEDCKKLRYRRKSDAQKQKVHAKFLAICEVSVSESARQWLRSPSFDCTSWQDEEIILLLQSMFLELNLPAKFGIKMSILRNFLYEVYKNYNEVPFHNFRHCFCVAQMMYAIALYVDIPNKMGDLDTLILLTSCICHDLDHPGYNNIYQINARTELALRYNDISPLENHHCSVAFRILENPDCNIFSSLDKETFREVREGIIRCILATDMARHNEIIAQFKEITPDFDFNNKTHRNSLSMILIKVADISNEARPMDVAEPWLDKLLQEFFKQSDAEKLEGLPVTPFMDREKITKPSSQCSFIGFVLLPLFEALGELFPQLNEFIINPVKDALEYYRRLNEAQKDERMQRKSVVEIVTSDNNDNVESDMVKSSSGHSVRSKRSLATLGSNQRSRSSDELDHTPTSSPTSYDVDDDDNEEHETATEVEVSEKTLKFKISTEASVTSSGRKSCPGSRKGSRERNQYSDNNYDLAERLKRSTTSETMESTGSDLFSMDNGRKGSNESEKNEENTRRGRRRISQHGDKLKVDYRRNSVAVVEKAKEKETHRRKSVCPNLEAQRRHKKFGVTRHVEIVNSVPENRVSRDFETSCWGLQNLKKDTTTLDNISYNIRPTSCEHLEVVPEVTSNNVKKEVAPTGSILSKLKNLTDKLSFSSNSDDNQEDRAMTLPKTKKINKTSTNKSGRGWRSFNWIGFSSPNKSQKTSSSLEFISPSESSPSPVRVVNRKHSVEEVITKVNNNKASPKRSLLSKFNKNSLTSSFRKKKVDDVDNAGPK